MDSAATFYGLASAFAWGAGDFYGGYASKAVHVLRVVAFSQTVGFILLVGLAVAVGEPLPGVADLGWAAAAGLMSGVGLIFYYAALSRGEMGAAAPVTGVLTAVVPALAGSLLEGVPSTLQAAGFFLAFVSIGLTTGSSGMRLSVNSQLGFSAVAGLGFGLFLVLLGQVSEGLYFYPLSVSRMITAGLAAFLAKTLLNTKSVGNAFTKIAAAGVFDTGGSFFYLLSRQAGRLDVAGVLSSLYPVSTVMLAKAILHEKLGKQRTAAIALAAAATTLINT
ncbi:MAG: DMT family transporter [Candidatus Caldarchaeum sp.]|nr:DMT family transporter [Candidatus Caldarchaeum sp.]MDW8435135.1 DMT family transporter [Candidatus Caldarchaeum sp.]